MRARSRSEIVAEGPVIEVVATAAPGSGIARYLVVLEARFFERANHQIRHVRTEVIVRKALRDALGERGTRFNRELIERKVRGSGSNRRLHLPRHLLECFARQREHQIKVEVSEHLTRMRGRAQSLICDVNSSELPKLFVHEALHADGNSVDACIAESPEAPLVHCAGVGLKRNLTVGCEPEQSVGPFKESGHGITAHQARRAAANEDRFDSTSACDGKPSLQILQYHVDIFPFSQIGRRGMGVEVTVGTLAHAPGPVQIKRQRNIRNRFSRPRRLSAHHQPQASRSSLCICTRALPRWLTRFFSSAVSSAAVRPYSGTKKCGS